jgi:hypothetical protein
MARELGGRLAIVLAAALATGGCGSGSGSSSGAVALGVVNTTPLAISLVVNGRAFETIRPQGADTAIRLGALPALPWLVEARTSTGRVLVSMNVTEIDTNPPGGAAGSGGREAAAQLSCGQVYLWTGPVEPPWPVPEPGSSGDCTP